MPAEPSNPVEESADRRVQAHAKAFVEGVLGSDSCHPDMEARRVRRWLLLTLAPLAMVLLLLAALIFIAWPSTVAGATDHVMRVVWWGFLALVFGASLGLSALLSVRASGALTRSSSAATASSIPDWAGALVLAVSLALLGLGVAYLADIATGRWRLLVVLLAVAPLPIIDAGLSIWRGRSRGGGSWAWGILGAALLLSCAISAAIMVLADFSDVFVSWADGILQLAIDSTSGVPILAPAVAGVVRVLREHEAARFLGVLTVLLVATLIVSRFMVFAVASRKAKDASKESEEAEAKGKQASKKGCLVGLVLLPFRWMKRLFGGAPKEVEPESAQDSRDVLDRHPWIVEFQQNFQEELVKLDPAAEGALEVLPQTPRRASVRAVEQNDPKAVAELQLHAWLFGGSPPSPAQLKALKRFIQRYESLADRYLAAERERRFEPIRETSDLLVMSEPGSGRTSTLIAMAIYAAAARGQRVLFVCRDARDSDRVAFQINETLRAGFLSHLVLAAPASRAGNDWMSELAELAKLQGDARAEQMERCKGSPQILVAQIEELENLLLGNGAPTAPRAAYLSAIGAVIVDALDPFIGDPIANIHSPYWLNKLRLLTDCRGYSLQVVVGVPDAGAVAPSDVSIRNAVNSYLKNCLLGTVDEGGEALVQLPPMGQSQEIVIDANAKGADEQVVLHALALALSRLERKTVIFKSDLHEKERKALEDELAKIVEGGVKPSVASSLEDFDSEQLHGAAVIVLRDSTRGRLIRRIANRLEAEEPVFVRVGVDSRSGEWSEGLSATLPVLATRASEPLLVAHLASIIPVVDLYRPFRVDWLTKFGLLDSGKYRKRAELFGQRPVSSLGTWSLRVDMSGELAIQPESESRLWNLGYFQTADRRAPESAQVEFHVAQGESKHFRSDAPNIVAGSTCPTAIDDRRYMKWIDGRGMPLGPSMDLSVAADLTYRESRERDSAPARWYATDLGRAVADRVIVGKPWRDRKSDQVLPIVELQFELAEAHRFTAGKIGLPPGIELLSADSCSPTVELRQRITSVITPGGSAKNITDIEWNQYARVTPLLLGACESAHDDREGTDYGIELRGGWSTTSKQSHDGKQLAHRGFWPLMTAAWQHAIDSVCPEMGRFGRIVVFHAPMAVEGAVLFVAEPLLTAGSAAHALETLLSESALSAVVRARLEEFVESSIDKELPPCAPCYAQSLRCTVSKPEADYCLEIIRASFDGRIGTAVPDAARFGYVRIAPREDSAVQQIPGLTRASGEHGVGGPSDRLFHDHNAAVAEYTRDGGCALSSDGPRFRIAQLIDAAASQAATDSFGADGDLWTRGAIVPEAVAAHAARGIRIRSDGMLEIDYAWMVKNSIKTLKPVADRLNELCKEAGLQSPRARVGMYASFVQSLQYSLGREGSRTDGRMAFGVQMPATTLHDGMGDCDSLALLFVSLLRAGGVCQSGLVLIGPTLAERNALDAQAVGHAMAAVEVDIQAAALDDVIEFSRGGEMRKALLVELTCPCAIGVADRRYQGRSVTVTAWGMT